MSRRGFGIAVTASGAPICAGVGGGRGRKPCHLVRRSARPEQVSGSPTATPAPPRVRVCPGRFRAGRGPSRSYVLLGARRGQTLIPPPRPLTLGRAPPHLTLPRRGSPAEPAVPGPTEQHRAGGGAGAARASALESPWLPPGRPGLPSRARAEPEDSPGPGCEEGVEGAVTPPLSVGRGRAAAAPRTAPVGAGPRWFSVAHAHLAGVLSRWRVRSDAGRRHGRGAASARARASCLKLRAAGRRPVAGPGPG